MLNKIKFGVLCLVLEVKIFLWGSFIAKKRGLKNFIPLFWGLLLVISPNILLAQAPQWPWTLIGEKIQITVNSTDNFTPSIASNGQFYLMVWVQKTPLGFDVYGVRIDKDGKRIPRFDKEGNSLEEEFPISNVPTINRNHQALGKYIARCIPR